MAQQGYYPDQYNFQLMQQGYSPEEIQMMQQQAQQQQATPINGLASMAGNIGGNATGNYMANSLMGGGSAATSAAGQSLASIAPEAGMNSISFGGMSVPSAASPNAIFTPEAGMLQNAMGYAAPLAVLGIGAYTASKGFDAMKNAEFSSKNPITGFKEGLKAAGPLKYVPVLGQLPALAGAAGAMFASGKDKDQHMRDQVRGGLKDSGFLDKDYNITLPDGTKFDIGKDGSYQNYNADWSKSGMGDLVGALNPLAAMMAHGDKKLTSDFAGYLSNASLSSGKTGNNVMKFYEDNGLNHDSAYGIIHQAFLDGKLDQATADTYKNGLDELYGVGAYKNKGKQKFNVGASGSAPIKTTVEPVKPKEAPKVETKTEIKSQVQSQPKEEIKPRDNVKIPTSSRLKWLRNA